MPSNLRALRLAAKLSMHQLATLAGTHQPQVWRFEHGEAPKGLKPALAIAAVLRCKITDVWPDVAPQRRTKLPRQPQASSVVEGRTRTSKNQGKRKR